MNYIKLTALPDTWYVEGTEVWDYDDNRRLTEEEWDRWREEGKMSIVLVCGIRQATPDCIHEIARFGSDKRVDGECCGQDEFKAEVVDTDGRDEIQKLIDSI